MQAYDDAFAGYITTANGFKRNVRPNSEPAALAYAKRYADKAHKKSVVKPPPVDPSSVVKPSPVNPAVQPPAGGQTGLITLPIK